MVSELRSKDMERGASCLGFELKESSNVGSLQKGSRAFRPRCDWRSKNPRRYWHWCCAMHDTVVSVVTNSKAYKHLNYRSSSSPNLHTDRVESVSAAAAGGQLEMRAEHEKQLSLCQAYAGSVQVGSFAL